MLSSFLEFLCVLFGKPVTGFLLTVAAFMAGVLVGFSLLGAAVPFWAVAGLCLALAVLVGFILGWLMG